MEWTFDMAVARAFSEMSAIRTAAPSRAKRMVVSRPIPLHRMKLGQSHISAPKEQNDNVF